MPFIIFRFQACQHRGHDREHLSTVWGRVARDLVFELMSHGKHQMWLMTFVRRSPTILRLLSMIPDPDFEVVVEHWIAKIPIEESVASISVSGIAYTSSHAASESSVSDLPSGVFR